MCTELRVESFFPTARLGWRQGIGPPLFRRGMLSEHRSVFRFFHHAPRAWAPTIYWLSWFQDSSRGQQGWPGLVSSLILFIFSETHALWEDFLTLHSSPKERGRCFCLPPLSSHLAAPVCSWVLLSRCQFPPPPLSGHLVVFYYLFEHGIYSPKKCYIK